MNKIAVISPPLYGHTEPVIPLLHALIEKGFEVHYYNSEKFRYSSNKTAVVFKPYTSFLEAHPLVHPSLIVFHREIPGVLRQLSTAFLDESYDLVIYDYFCFWAKYLAMSYDINRICLHTTYPDIKPSGSIIRSKSYISLCNTDLFYIDRYKLEKYTKIDKNENIIVIDEEIFLSDSIRSCSFLSKPKRVRAVHLLNTPASVNLVLMPEEFLDPDRKYQTKGYYFIGTMHHLTPEKKPENTRLIYASLGTRSKLIEVVVKTWTKRPEKTGLHLLAAAGKGEKGAARNIRGDITIEDFADQKRILQKADAFITHGGMGSVMEAVLTETPMLVIPLTPEQQTTAEKVAMFGLGRLCSFDNLTSLNLQKCVIDLANDQQIRENLIEWRKKFCDNIGLERALQIVREQLSL